MDNSVPDSTPQKQCRTCKAFKDATNEFFNTVPVYISPDLLNTQCKVCRSAARKGKHAKKQVAPLAYRHTPEGVEVPLTQGKFTLVDECDLDLFDGCKWSYCSRDTPNAKKNRYTEESGFAKRVMLIDGWPKTIRLHWLILERKLGYSIPEGYLVDHQNGNPLDNRRENLRLATHAQNAQNSAKEGNHDNPYKGVSYDNSSHPRIKRWGAKIFVNGKNKMIGRFHTSEEAALAYNKAALKYYGEFARLNEIAS